MARTEGAAGGCVAVVVVTAAWDDGRRAGFGGLEVADVACGADVEDIHGAAEVARGGLALSSTSKCRTRHLKALPPSIHIFGHPSARQGCQMVIAKFLDRICLALRA